MQRGDNEAVRIDRWLWAARFFKTRGLAKQAIDGGKVVLNGHRAKPAKGVQPGDEVVITRDDFKLELTVRAVSERRLSATLAAALFEESLASIEAREKAIAERKQRRQQSLAPDRRPDKRDRRQLRDFKGR